jgi:hypothetical protein
MDHRNLIHYFGTSAESSGPNDNKKTQPLAWLLANDRNAFNALKLSFNGIASAKYIVTP